MPREKNGVQFWSCPEWLDSARKLSQENGKPNLFFLDEFTRGPRLVLAAMLPFLLEGVLHTHRIGDKDAVIAAANPATDDYEVNELIDAALLNRLGHIIVKPSNEEYIDFLSNKKMDSVTMKLLMTSPNWIKINDFELGFEVKPSRRSIFNVMSIIGKMSPKWIKQSASHIIEAYLGPAFRDEWLSEYLNRDNSVTMDMLIHIDSYEDEIVRILTTEIDGQETHRLDLLSKIIDMIKVYISENHTKITEKDAEWMIKFFSLSILPDDACASLFMSNKYIKKMMISNLKFNKKISNFLKQKKITQTDVLVWD
jgi:hypothetical protein